MYKLPDLSSLANKVPPCRFTGVTPRLFLHSKSVLANSAPNTNLLSVLLPVTPNMLVKLPVLASENTTDVLEASPDVK